MARDVRVLCGFGIPLRQTARLHAIEEVTDVERRRVFADLDDRSAGEQLRRTQHQLAAVACFDPAGLSFKPHRARAERNPIFLAEDQLDAVLVLRDQVAVFRRVVFNRRQAIVDGPLAEIHAVRTPLKHAASTERTDEPATFFEMETVEQRLIKRSPSGRAEIRVEVHFRFVRFRFRRQPTAHDGLHPSGVSKDFLHLAELPGASQFASKRIVRQVASLSSRLEHSAGAANHVVQDQALRDVLRARLLAIDVLAGFRGGDRHRRVPVRAGRDQNRINVAAVEQLAVIANHLALVRAVLLVDHFLDQRAASFLHVANRHELDIALLQEFAEVVESSVSNADPADNDPLAGSDRTIESQSGTRNDHRCQHCGTGCRKGRLQKLTPMKLRNLLRHDCFS